MSGLLPRLLGDLKQLEENLQKSDDVISTTYKEGLVDGFDKELLDVQSF